LSGDFPHGCVGITAQRRLNDRKRLEYVLHCYCSGGEI
jgi:hypothetical protein